MFFQPRRAVTQTSVARPWLAVRLSAPRSFDGQRPNIGIHPTGPGLNVIARHECPFQSFPAGDAGRYAASRDAASKMLNSVCVNVPIFFNSSSLAAA
jgi:hypothetical protein